MEILATVGPAGLLPVGIALLPLVIVVVALAWKRRAWSTREVPGAFFRLLIGALFAACVVPAWGLLAAQAAAWWWVRGWVIRSGGLLWPTATAVLFVGLQAPPWAVELGIYTALGMGVAQSLLAVSQWREIPLLYLPGQVFGTIGHRTGLGIYLGMLVPLGFSTEYGWAFLAAYLPGLILARSSVGYAAAASGLLWVHPDLWPVAVGSLMLGAVHRFVKWNEGHVKQRILSDALRARWTVWCVCLWKAQRWPFWLIGHGGDSFHEDGRTWIYNHKLTEEYKEAHNDYVEFLYEYGVLGVVALVWYGYTIAPGVRLSDPFTGALIAMLVASLGNFPVRVASIVGLAALCLIVIHGRLV
jgi:hypothetical protein